MKTISTNFESIKPFRKRIYFNLIIIFSLIKLICLALFSSGYQSELFYPFTNWFINNWENPWEAIDKGIISAEFPYSSVMLYTLSFFNYIIFALDIENHIASNFIYSIPLFIADVSILFSLVKLAQNNKYYISLTYFFSPIIFFSTYLHQQLDTIPIALLLISIIFLTSRKYFISAAFFGLAMSAKLNVFLSFPLLAIYILKNHGLRNSVFFSLVSIITFFLTSIEYIFSEPYISNVIFNEKQKFLLESSIKIGFVELYIPLFISILLYAYFFSLKKVNKDLLMAFIALLFLSNIFFMSSSPGWYVWAVPFILFSIAKKESRNTESYIVLVLLHIFYILYFLVANEYELTPITFLEKDYHLSISNNDIINNILFTILQSSLVFTSFVIYSNSIKSNNLYQRKTPFIIGVGGDSGTGKTTLNTLIAKIFNDNLLQIEGDGDHRWERGSENWTNHTHLNPKANWLHRQSENLLELKNWRAAKRVDYDHTTGKFTSQYSIKPKEFILISGLHPFYLPISRKSLDLKIYMDPNETLRRYWKVQRDMTYRGYSLEKILSQIEARVCDARKYIYPQKHFSDLIISFFPQNKISNFTDVADLNVGLRIQCEASISIENILTNLKIEHSWDYAEDLKSQVIELYSSPDHVDFTEVANKHIPNIDELMYDGVFDTGYDGFIQLVTLLSISQKMKGR